MRRILIAVALATAASAAPAHGVVHWSIGIGIGAPYYGWSPGWWGYPPPVVVAVPPPPPVVVVPAQPLAPPVAYWYYCYNPAGYYPQVQTCPGGWTPVPAQPAQ